MLSLILNKFLSIFRGPCSFYEPGNVLLYQCSAIEVKMQYFSCKNTCLINLSAYSFCQYSLVIWYLYCITDFRINFPFPNFLNITNQSIFCVRFVITYHQKLKKMAQIISKLEHSWYQNESVRRAFTSQQFLDIHFIIKLYICKDVFKQID